MKAILVLVLLTFSASANNLQSQVSSLLQSGTSAGDAIDAAFDLLKSLKQSQLDENAEALKVNITQEAELGKQVDDFRTIAEMNKENGDQADALKKHYSDEIEKTIENLHFIQNRRHEVIRKRNAVHEQRCASAMIFVSSIKQHREALEVIKLLKEDVVGVVENAGSFSQIQSSVEKLQAYSHLFNKEAIDSFMQLSQEAHNVDDEKLQYDQKGIDNDRDSLNLKQFDSGVYRRNVGQRFIDMINKLHQHILDSLENLKENEIQAAWDVVEWLTESETELTFLDKDEDAKKIYLDKLQIQIVNQTAHCERLWAIYFESSAAFHNAVENREKVRIAYLAAKAIRDENIQLLDDLINQFSNQVSVLDSSLRNLTTDYHEDGNFDTDIKRSVDDIYSRDSGKLHSNIVAEQSQ